MTVPAGYPPTPAWLVRDVLKGVLKSDPAPCGVAYTPVWILIIETSLGYWFFKSCAILCPSGQYVQDMPVNSSRIIFLFSGAVLTKVWLFVDKHITPKHHWWGVNYIRI